ncbi:MAG: ribonuclease Z [Clostridiales bacterium]|jgi:ribonuclease Z|nr:ribonuclease Z [Clostridiales bacterium]
MMEVALLGTGGMMPLPNRFLTSLMTRVDGRLLLIDCGEATQVTLKLLGWGFKNIDHICFTHFHADHISGLPGMLLSIGNSERKEPVTLIGPQGLSQVFAGLRVIAPYLPFEVNIIEIPYGGSGEEGEEMLVNEEGLYLNTLSLNHRIPCLGYSLNLKRKGAFDVERARKLNIPIKNWNYLQKGQTVVVDGVTYTPDMVLGNERKGIKVSYITDTRPIPEMAEFAKDSDIFICEGLYGHDDFLPKAAERRHMIFSEAASVAAQANVKKLWLTHYSPAMPDPQNYIQYARAIFPNSFTCRDRTTEVISFEHSPQ